MTADHTTPTRAEGAPIETDALANLLASVTPGPWMAESGHVQRNGTLYWQVTDNHDAIMQNQYCCTRGDAAANARLIALAPQLAAEVLALRAAPTDNTALVEALTKERDALTENRDKLNHAYREGRLKGREEALARLGAVECENERLRDALEWVEQHGDCRGEAVQVIAAALEGE